MIIPPGLIAATNWLAAALSATAMSAEQACCFMNVAREAPAAPWFLGAKVRRRYEQPPSCAFCALAARHWQSLP
jgi:hypothetical protein